MDSESWLQNVIFVVVKLGAFARQRLENEFSSRLEFKKKIIR